MARGLLFIVSGLATLILVAFAAAFFDSSNAETLAFEDPSTPTLTSSPTSTPLASPSATPTATYIRPTVVGLKSDSRCTGAVPPGAPKYFWTGVGQFMTAGSLQSPVAFTGGEKMSSRGIGDYCEVIVESINYFHKLPATPTSTPSATLTKTPTRTVTPPATPTKVAKPALSSAVPPLSKTACESFRVAVDGQAVNPIAQEAVGDYLVGGDSQCQIPRQVKFHWRSNAEILQLQRGFPSLAFFVPDDIARGNPEDYFGLSERGVVNIYLNTSTLGVINSTIAHELCRAVFYYVKKDKTAGGDGFPGSPVVACEKQVAAKHKFVR